MKMKKRGLAVASVVAAVLGLSAVAIAPANATSTCPTGSTAVAGGTICQVIETTSGSWVIPTGVTAVSTMLIGGGGGAVYGSTYQQLGAGGGGGVERINSTAIASLGSTISYTVGHGGTSMVTATFTGTANTSTSGTTSSVGGLVTSSGGGHGSFMYVSGVTNVAGGNSGAHLGANQSLSTPTTAGAAGGGGANGAAVGNAGGSGVVPSTLFFGTVDAAFWPASADGEVGGNGYFGVGGSGGSSAGAGNYGYGASSGDTQGMDGAVVFRFAPIVTADPTPTNSTSSGSGLATTGTNLATPLSSAGILALAGLGAIALRRRTVKK